ncbi:hypothetical protein L227DRAFT_587910 [Lentinus tigrinus ALCF2SS1-6]|uniref:Uncharacterized protein n=1 Tax=Lentinus tigrinus ALCF2SS1-6 TaxID=1328759 RepID=A0A5C2S0K3_9APHY|nr:hypothetical protein L227DRAFT_587910 [Lentinus tigrinus ALCF2SS1-6]
MQPSSLAGLPDHLRAIPPPPPPEPDMSFAQAPENAPSPSPSEPPCAAPPFIETKLNSFNLFRRYSGRPQHDPEEDVAPHDFADAPTHARPPPDPDEANPLRPFGSRLPTSQSTNMFAPFLNATVFRLMKWFYSGSAVKSAGELDRLVNDVLLAEDFDREDLRGFRAAREFDRMDAFAATQGAFSADDGWREGSIKINVPKEKISHESEESAPELEVSGIYFRTFLEVIKAAAQAVDTRKAHWLPFGFYWRRNVPPTGSQQTPEPAEDVPASEERMYSELYNSDAMIEADQAIQSAPREAGDAPDLEYAVAPIMLYSDSTHLTNFGTASLWPIYVFFGWLSKYVRAKPNSFVAHHLAYIPSLPDTVQAWYQKRYGEPASAAILRFCKRELMQKIWMLLLDTDFVHAYEHGFLNDIYLMGTKRDLASRTKNARKDTGPLQHAIATVRRWIFQDGISPEASRVENSPLNTHSTTSSRSAFSTRLFTFGFDVYQMLVPDPMHEFELGVWKSTFTHLIRVLIAAGGACVQQLDKRFSQVPTFGRDTVRRFGANVSALKKLAARDFEDILQVAIPVFEGLLNRPGHNKIVLDMLFLLATWHALAKLRIHSDSSLTRFERICSSLGVAMRMFMNKLCPDYDTKELPKETASRQRRKAATAAKAPPAKALAAPSTSPHPAPRKEPAKRKRFDLNTYKFHRLGDYPRCIRRFATTDGWTTQTGELEHRRVKRFYSRTNKNSEFAGQIAKHQRREALIYKVASTAPIAALRRRRKLGRRLQLQATDKDPLSLTLPTQHYHISDDPRNTVKLDAFAHENQDDPACERFVYKVKAHIYERLTGQEPQTRDHVVQVRIRSDALHLHKRVRLNYTTYDMRRAQDSINPTTHSDVMMLAPPDEASIHPYVYARVLSVFHVKAYIAGYGGSADSEEQLLHILWVRWFELDNTAPGGFSTHRLHRLRFAHVDEDAFGFISPSRLLRGAHLIPAFAHGRSDSTLPGSSIARRDSDGEEDQDWNYHYVGMFSDRDLFMRYFGNAVGHQHTAAVTAAQPEFDETEDERPEEHDQNDAAASATNDGIPGQAEDDPENDEAADYGYISSGDEDELGGGTSLFEEGQLDGDVDDAEEDITAAEGYAAL